MLAPPEGAGQDDTGKHQLGLLPQPRRKYVARNDIFGLKWIYYGPKGGILDY